MFAASGNEKNELVLTYNLWQILKLWEGMKNFTKIKYLGDKKFGVKKLIKKLKGYLCLLLVQRI